MKLPYNLVFVCGDVLFAARGGKIHSFSLTDGSYISTWKHPDTDKVSETFKQTDSATKENADTEQSDEPPTKRAKLDVEPQADETLASEDGSSQIKNGKVQNKKSKTEARNKRSQVPDRPMFAQMTGTADGSHVVAVSGHDKTLWVLQHDGKGNFTQLSRRMMPKRPSSIAVAPDGNIISADKFGDVYSLPLIMSEASPETKEETPEPFKTTSRIEATTFTVHSRTNRLALINQQKQREKNAQGQGQSKAEKPAFALTLLLGHVSMLTSLTLAQHEGRKYIITADRDEHIRVSRQAPQAHVIESYCLGHNEFVSSTTVPAGRSDVLVSGGGDPDLFIWDYRNGALLSKTGILSLAQEIAPETTKVAVTKLYTLEYPSDSVYLTYILAICEGVKAIFSWHLTESNMLNRPGIIQLPGSPLSLDIRSSSDGGPPSIIAAVDLSNVPAAQGLHKFSLTMNEGRLAVDIDTPFQDEILERGEDEVAENEIGAMFYTTENLRKQKTQAGKEGEAANSEAMEDAAEDVETAAP